jgi:hypothetical protein
MKRMAEEGSDDAVIALLQASEGLDGAAAADLIQKYDDEVITKDPALAGNIQAQNDAYAEFENRVNKAKANVAAIQGMRDAIAKNVSSKATRVMATVANAVVSPIALGVGVTAGAVGAVYAAPLAAKVATGLSTGVTASINTIGTAGTFAAAGAAGASAGAGIEAVKAEKEHPGRVIDRASRSLSRFFGG